MAKKIVLSLFLLLLFPGILCASSQILMEYSQFDFQHYEDAIEKGHWWRVKESTDPFSNERNFLLSLPCNRSVEADPYTAEKLMPRGILHIRYEDGDADLFLYSSTSFMTPFSSGVKQGDVRFQLDEGAIQNQKWNMFERESIMIRNNLWFFPKESLSLENFVGQLFEHEKMAIEISASGFSSSINESYGFNLKGLSDVLKPYLDQIGFSSLKDHPSYDDLDDAGGQVGDSDDVGDVGGIDNNGGSSSGGCFLNSL